MPTAVNMTLVTLFEYIPSLFTFRSSKLDAYSCTYYSIHLPPPSIYIILRSVSLLFRLPRHLSDKYPSYELYCSSCGWTNQSAIISHSTTIQSDNPIELLNKRKVRKRRTHAHTRTRTRTRTHTHTHTHTIHFLQTFPLSRLALWETGELNNRLDNNTA